MVEVDASLELKLLGTSLALDRGAFDVDGGGGTLPSANEAGRGGIMLASDSISCIANLIG